jgi:hypothetical protein
MEPGDLTRIKAGTTVSAVLSVQHDECLTYWGIDYTRMIAEGEELGLTMARHPIRDFDIVDQRKNLPVAVAKLAQLRSADHRVYVHCTAGMGRAPLVALGYLTLVERIDPEAAIHKILAGRPVAVPSWEAYHGAREDLVARFRPTIERRAYELYERGVHGDARADWCEAEADVLSGALAAV